MNNDIQESYVDFENAKLLKEIGFNCLTKEYYQKGKGIEGLVTGKMDRHNSKEDFYISAPTIDLAIEWIRINFDRHIYCQPYYCEDSELKWRGKYCNLKRFNVTYESFLPESVGLYDSPQEAKQVAIKHFLNSKL
jgi:hypothetical protein